MSGFPVAWWAGIRPADAAFVPLGPSYPDQRREARWHSPSLRRDCPAETGVGLVVGGHGPGRAGRS